MEESSSHLAFEESELRLELADLFLGGGLNGERLGGGVLRLGERGESRVMAHGRVISAGVPPRGAMATPPQLETELNTYRTIQKEIGKVQNQMSTAGTQILENEMVLKVAATRRPCAFTHRALALFALAAALLALAVTNLRR